MDELSEIAYWASMVLGDPCLLIGSPGSAKTALVEAMGECLNLSYQAQPGKDRDRFEFQIYDCSMINMEDLVGFPDPKSTTSLKFIPSGMTIWGKHLVCFDEYSRQNPDQQNNILQITRSRKVQGVPLQDLMMIVNCMNPYGDEGTNMLSEALADRNLFAMKVKDFGQMSANDQKRIMERFDGTDSPALGFWTQNGVTRTLDTQDKVDAGHEIRKLLGGAAKYYEAMQEQYSGKTYQVVRELVQQLIQANSEAHNPYIVSGRRASMIQRAIPACYAVQQKLNDLGYNCGDVVTEKFNELMQMCLMYWVTGTYGVDHIAKIQNAVHSACSTHVACDNNRDFISQIAMLQDPVDILHAINNADLGMIDATEAWAKLVADKNSSHEIKKLVFAMGELGYNTQNYTPPGINLQNLLDSMHQSVMLRSQLVPFQDGIDAQYHSLTKKQRFLANYILSYYNDQLDDGFRSVSQIMRGFQIIKMWSLPEGETKSQKDKQLSELAI